MSAMTNYTEDQIIQTFLRTSETYIGIFTAAPSDAGGGTECSYSGYARKSSRGASLVTPSAAWAATVGGNGTTSNTQEIAFAEVAGSSVTVTHFAIFDAASGGNMLFHGALTASKTMDVGDVPVFAAGSLILQFD